MTRGIDHLVLAVRDLGKARAFFEALGFTTTPRAIHPPVWGTMNHLVQLRGCFLELVAMHDPGTIPPAKPGEFNFGAYNRDFLARREGLSMLAFQSHDARRDLAEFSAAGLETHAPFDFGRDAKQPDGSVARVAFSLAFVTHPGMPEAVFFSCQQNAPRYFWKLEYQTHANGARSIAEVVMVASDPPAVADSFFARLQGREAVEGKGEAVRVATARGRITVLTPDAFAARFPGAATGPATPHFAAFRISGVDPAAQKARLAAAGIACAEREGAVQVPRAFGAAIEFAA